MTDNQPPQGPTQPGSGPQNQGQGGDVPPLVVNAQYVKDFSFENPSAPQSLLQQSEPPAVQINVDVKANKVGNNAYEVSLQINAEAKSKEQVVFLAELVYAGVFTLRNIPEEQIQPVLLVECPRLLFPFARAVIADATREGGFAPLLVHPIDFAGLYLQQQGGQAQEQAGGQPQGQPQGQAQGQDQRQQQEQPVTSPGESAPGDRTGTASS